MSEKLYSKFHRAAPDKVQEIPFVIPKELIKLGRVTAIEYECDQPSKFTKGTYRHEFKKPVILAADKSGVLYIIRAKITSRGIEDR